MGRRRPGSAPGQPGLDAAGLRGDHEHADAALTVTADPDDGRT